MATLSEDDSSWKAGGVRKRDHRHDAHASPESLPRAGKAKDTRRWCKGKVGREHRWKRVPDPPVIWWRWLRQERCESCGKKRWVERTPERAAEMGVEE